MKKILIYIHILLNYPFFQYRFSKKWDSMLNLLMDSHYFERRSEFTACLGTNVIWVSNFPYASFFLYNGPRFRPSIRTIVKAKIKLEKEAKWFDKLNDMLTISG